MFRLSRNLISSGLLYNNSNLIVSLKYVSSGGAGVAKTEIQSRWRKIWTRWIPIPTGVGITLLAVLQWRNVRNKHLQEEQQRSIRDWEITCYRSVPFRPLSRAWGWISDRPVPQSLRHWVYGNYSKLYAVNLDEIELDLISYVSLAEFFSRRLKNGVRPIDSTYCVVSPADGTILNFGEVTSCHIEQVKGITYSIQTFLGDTNWKESPYIQMNHNPNENNVDNKLSLAPCNNNDKFYSSDSISNESINRNNNIKNINFNLLSNARYSSNNAVSWNQYKRQLLRNPDENELYQLVVYLAPGDYHRFHSPVHWNVHYRRHFQGELLSVNPVIASWVPELFSLNERVIYFGEWQHGFFSMAAVGATNVGSIRVHSDTSLHTNGRKWPHGVKHKDKEFDMVWRKGEEVGEFRMGSTIVVLFEAPRGCKFNIEPSQRVKVGESITCLLDKGSCEKDKV